MKSSGPKPADDTIAAAGSKPSSSKTSPGGRPATSPSPPAGPPASGGNAGEEAAATAMVLPPGSAALPAKAPPRNAKYFIGLLRKHLFPALRKGEVSFVDLGPVELFFWGLTIVSLVVAALNDSSDPDGKNEFSFAVRVTDICLSVIFVIEMLLRAAFDDQRSVLLGQDAAYKKPLRVLDAGFLIANIVLHSLSLLDIIDLKVSLLVLRSPRVLRPFFTITSQPNLRLFVVSITRALLRAKDVIILYAFFLLWVSVSAVYQFGGLMRPRCVNDAYFANDTSVQLFISTNNLTVNDFVCGSGFLEYHEAFESLPYYNDFLNSGEVDMLTLHRTESCSVAATCVSNTSNYLSGFKCPYSFSCTNVQNTYHGYVGFDHLAQSLMSLFVSLTFQLWYESMFWIADSGDVLAYVYFTMLMLVGGFMIANVTVVILTIEYEKAKNRERQNLVNQLKGVSAENAALQLVKNELTDALAMVRGETTGTGGSAAAAGATAEAHADDGDDADGGAGGKKKGKRRRKKKGKKSRRGEGGNDAGGDVEMKKEEGPADFTKWDGDWTDELKRGESNTIITEPAGAAALLLEEEARQALEEQSDEEDEALLEEQRRAEAEANKKQPTALEKVRHFMHHRVVKTPLFTLLGTVVILANFAIIAYDHYGMPQSTKDIFADMNLGFTIYFTIEMIVRFFAHHPILYFSKFFNVLDIVIVVGAWIDVAVADVNLPIVRALRVLRVLKLLKHFPSLYEWLRLIVNAIKTSPMLVVVLSLLLFTFACLGMNLFGGRFCGLATESIHLRVNQQSLDVYGRLLGDQTLASIARALNVTDPLFNTTALLSPDDVCDGLPQANFDTIGTAFITAFQIMTADDWEYIMYDAMRVRGVWIALLFIAFFFVSNFFVLNLIVAILLNANQREDTDFSGGEDLDAKIRRLEAQEEEEERKRREEEEKQRELDEADKDPDAEDDDEDDSIESEDDDGAGHRRSKTVRTKSGKVKEKSYIGRFIDLLFVAWGLSRRGAKLVVAHPWTPRVMAVVIIFGSVCQGLEDPLAAPDTVFATTLETIDIVVTVIYVVELALNVHAYGFFARSTSYIQRDKWNIFDCFLVVVSLIGIIVADLRDDPFVRALKVLRALRPLRLVKRSPGMRLVLSSLMSAVPEMTNVAVVGMIVFIIFGVAGVQFYGGRLRSCFIGDENFPTLDIGPCEDLGGQFINDMAVNFDTLPGAFVALFVVATLEAWSGLMYRVMNSREPGLAPQRNATWEASIYFMLFAFFVGLFLLNFFVSVLIDAYNREKRRGSVRRSLMVTREQEAWILTNRRIAKHLPIDDKNIDEESDEIMDIIRRENYELRKRTRELVRSESFKKGIALAILVSFVSMAFYWYPGDPQVIGFIEAGNVIFTVVFVLEALLKIYAEGMRMYFATAWNRTDFFIAVASMMSLILDAAGIFDPRSLSLIRTLRVVRLVRYIRRWVDIDQMIRMMGKALLALGHVLAFIFLVFFIFAVLGMNLFGRVHMGVFGATTGIDRHSNFVRLDHAMFTLLRITLGGNWGDIMQSCQVTEPFCDPQLGECGASAPIPQLYFVVFLFVSMFMLRNLFIAVMLDSFNSSGEERGISKEHAAIFYDKWKQFDEENEMVIAPFDTLHMLRLIPARASIGFNGRGRRQRVALELQYLVGLKLLNTHDPVPMAVFIDALCARAFNCPMPPGGSFLDAVSGDKNFLGTAIFSQLQDQVVGFAKDSQQMTKKLLDTTSKAAQGLTKKLQTGAAHLTGIQLQERQIDGELEFEREQRLIAANEARQQELEAEALQRKQEEELHRRFTEVASLIIINGIMRRRKELIREHLIMQEKIAQRKFSDIGIMKARQALRSQRDGMAAGDPSALTAMSAMIGPTATTAVAPPAAASPAASPATEAATTAPAASVETRALPPPASAPPPGTVPGKGPVPVADAVASLPMRSAVSQSKGKRRPGKTAVEAPKLVYATHVDHLFPDEMNRMDDAEERTAHNIAMLLRSLAEYDAAHPGRASLLQRPSSEDGGLHRAPVAFAAAARVSALCSEALESTPIPIEEYVNAGGVAVAKAPFVLPAAPRDAQRFSTVLASPSTIGRLVALAAHVSAAAALAVQNATAQLVEASSRRGHSGGVDTITTTLPLALLPGERERLTPSSIRMLWNTVDGEARYLMHKLKVQHDAIEAASETRLVRSWFAEAFSFDEIPTGDFGELRRWGQGPPALGGGGGGFANLANSTGGGSHAASRANSDDDDDGRHSSRDGSRPTSIAPSHLDRGSELGDLPELLHARADEDPLSGFHYGFFDRLELVYGVIGALEAMTPTNLSAPFPLATALPLVDAVLDHVGGVTFEWDRAMVAYLHAPPSASAAAVASTGGGGGIGNDNGSMVDGKMSFASEPSPGLQRSMTSKALKSGGTTAAAAAANVKPLPLQLNFESPFVVELLCFMSEGVNQAAAANGDQGQSASPTLTLDSLNALNSSLGSPPQGSPHSHGNRSFGGQNRMLSSPSQGPSSPPRGLLPSQQQQQTTLLKFKIQMAAHVERIKDKRHLSRAKWGALMPPPPPKLGIMASLGSTSAAKEALAAPPPPAPAALANDPKFAPIHRRCRNFRNTLCRYMQSVRKAVMVAMIQLDNVEEDRKASIDDNRRLLEAKIAYAGRIADMVSFVDEVTAWMPQSLATAVRLEQDEFDDDDDDDANGDGEAPDSVHVLAARMQKHLLESAAELDVSIRQADESRSAIVPLHSPLNMGSPRLGRTTNKSTPLHNLCIAARLSDAASRLARAGVTAVQRRAIVDEAIERHQYDHFEYSDGTTEGPALLTAAFATTAIERLERLVAAAVAAPRTNRRATSQLFSPRSQNSVSFASPNKPASLANDSIFGRREVSEFISTADGPTPAPSATASELRHVLAALRGSELQDRIEVLRTHGVSALIVRRWEPCNAAGAMTPKDPLTCIQLRPAGYTRHSLKLNAAADAFEFWKPGNRQPVARIALSEIASIDRDGGAQYEVADSDGKLLGRPLRITLGRLGGSAFSPNVTGASSQQRLGWSDSSNASAAAPAAQGSRSFKMNSRFELVPDGQFDAAAAAEEGSFRTAGESGHFNRSHGYSRRHQPPGSDGGAEATRDGEIPFSRTTPPPQAEGGATAAASFGHRAVMSTESYALSSTPVVDPNRGRNASAVRLARQESIVFVLPASLGYGEWLMLLRDVVRYAPLLPLVLDGLDDAAVISDDDDDGGAGGGDDANGPGADGGAAMNRAPIASGAGGGASGSGGGLRFAADSSGSSDEEEEEEEQEASQLLSMSAPRRRGIAPSASPPWSLASHGRVRGEL